MSKKKTFFDDITPWIQEASAKLHYVWYVMHAGTVVLPKQIDINFSFIGVIVKDLLGKYFYDEPNIKYIAKTLIGREIKNQGYTASIIAQWKTYADSFYRTCEKIEKTKLSVISTKELRSLYAEFLENYSSEYAIALLTDPMGPYLEFVVRKELEKVLPTKKGFNQLLIALTEPAIESFVGQEQYELYCIAIKSSSGLDISKDLVKHAKNWHWIQNNYCRAIKLPKSYFESRVKEHIKAMKPVQDYVDNYSIDSIKENKEKLLARIGANSRLKVLIQLTDQYAKWQDDRKRANLIADYYISIMIKEVSRRFKISSGILEQISGFEFLGVLDGKILDVLEIKKRNKMNAIISTPNRCRILNFEDSMIAYDELESMVVDTEYIKEVHGQTANIGKVVGKVKVIRSSAEFNIMKKGDILVTSMTRPEFIPIMKMASGIITDEGGITCHAAIVSRELRIPCIIGTKIATKVLKSGDRVDLNANHGVVKLLDRFK